MKQYAVSMYDTSLCDSAIDLMLSDRFRLKLHISFRRFVKLPVVHAEAYITILKM